MRPTPEVLTSKERLPRKFVVVALLMLVALGAVVVGASVLSRRDGASPPVRRAADLPVLHLRGNHGVSTDRDQDQFTYALSVTNATGEELDVVAIELVPATGLRVVLATVITPAEFTQVWDPRFVPPERPGRSRVAARAEAVLLVRAATDCVRAPTIDLIRVVVRQNGREVRQEIPTKAANSRSAAPDLRLLPKRVCS